jgi:hypothetical protein
VEALGADLVGPSTSWQHQLLVGSYVAGRSGAPRAVVISHRRLALPVSRLLEVRNRAYIVYHRLGSGIGHQNTRLRISGIAAATTRCCRRSCWSSQQGRWAGVVDLRGNSWIRTQDHGRLIRDLRALVG